MRNISTVCALMGLGLTSQADRTAMETAINDMASEYTDLHALVMPRGQRVAMRLVREGEFVNSIINPNKRA